MYDQVKKSWAKQSVALDVSCNIFMSELMLKALIFEGEKVLAMEFSFSSFNYLFMGSNFSVKDLNLMKAIDPL